MHLLAAKPGTISDGGEAVDLGQSPAEIVVLSAADTELACLAAAHAALPEPKPSLRLANLLQLQHNMSVDLYLDQVIADEVKPARLVVLRLIGGQRYWPYGVEQLALAAQARGFHFACLSGDDQPDPELARHSTLPADAAHRLWQYQVHGGQANAENFLRYAAHLVGKEAAGNSTWDEPRPLLRAGLYWPGANVLSCADLQRHWLPGRPVAGIVFYRALLQAGTTAPIDALIAALLERGLNPLPVFVNSLKEAAAADLIRDLYAGTAPDLTLNCTGFAISQPGAATFSTPFDGADHPVLQVALSSESEETWQSGSRGLSPRDLAMQVALPELDGRILARAISWKSAARYDAATQCTIVAPSPRADRVAFVADLAAHWVRLRRTPAPERRVALVLANYPNKDGRVGAGVGLDTPAGTIAVLQAMRASGYALRDIPADGDALMRALLERIPRFALPVEEYRRCFATLPEKLQREVTARWAAPDQDPHVADGAFQISLLDLGHVLVGIQPSRGYDVDAVATYHDADLVPPHYYFAFYLYLRSHFGAHAFVHMGKHGNMEWLPGKALALSAACYPEAVFGPVPHLYPFIVNDPGEGAQAKRRAQAVIIDHMTPPLTRAESYGPLRDLERLVDEYFEAAQVDPRRCVDLKRQILDLAISSGLAADCGVLPEDDTETALAKLDNHLCELKEAQIRDGLHVFGEAPSGAMLDELLVALTRLPRGKDEGGGQSLIRALSRDLALDFDPLNAALGEKWQGPRPAALQAVSADSWRLAGDTVERLELLALALVSGKTVPAADWANTQAVLAFIADDLKPRVSGCGAAEIANLLRGLDGRFVPPGPSGAPTRGRLDVLPTGRNFFSVDTRSVPTQTAWALGWQSALLVLERHRQEHGAWPRAIVLSAWGTANMRTGGDDIAQALALMGVRPTWDPGGSGRLNGFEVMPLSVLGRPRVDVTLRVSGFFRDAFPAQIDLFDSAVRAVADLDEPDDQNPLAARVRAERAALMADGVAESEASRRAGYRVFGSRPGAYGAGLQSLIDAQGWQETGDLARAYLAWGGYAYGAGVAGVAEQQGFARRLGGVEAVLHNQDNAEHDLLDSDNYWQFEGGLAAAVTHLSGKRAVVWHNDHARPEALRVRALDEEIARVVRARVVNPKWIGGVMRHGYKGGSEMAATVDYLFAYAATANCVAAHHFDAVYAAYLEDDEVRGFLEDHNPAALREIAARLLEAQSRGLWQARSNSAGRNLAAWAEGSAAA
ncbi:cobaltochelatase CobN subunit [Dongia mobilis]|uniref:Cobaltochelatase subunit CobN n=1 Tax=Dongia mobilis TaxID=578943 RepID=A0A4R6WTE7_9PROT|nr:cobaltochelatase subunit CobN [Dongia mobilis]TDQ86410.1 cobaltochelatase CobN subunit [Dongia mobilis]